MEEKTLQMFPLLIKKHVCQLKKRGEPTMNKWDPKEHKQAGKLTVQMIFKKSRWR